MELAGNIKDFSVVEICQFIWISKRTGKLMLHLEESGRRFESSVFFATGSITASFTDIMKGKDAFFAICEAESGSFRFIGDEMSAETNIIASMDQLLLEASGRIKLYETLRREIPTPNIVYSISPDFNTYNLVFDKNQWAVIALIDGKNSLGEISKELGLPEFDVMRIFYSLLQVGVARRLAIKIPQVSASSSTEKKSIITRIIDYLRGL